MRERILTGLSVRRHPGGRPRLWQEACAGTDGYDCADRVEFVQPTLVAGREREIHRVRLTAMIHATVVFVTTAGHRCVGAQGLWPVAVVGIV